MDPGMRLKELAEEKACRRAALQRRVTTINDWGFSPGGFV